MNTLCKLTLLGLLLWLGACGAGSGAGEGAADAFLQGGGPNGAGGYSPFLPPNGVPDPGGDPTGGTGPEGSYLRLAVGGGMGISRFSISAEEASEFVRALRIFDQNGDRLMFDQSVSHILAAAVFNSEPSYRGVWTNNTMSFVCDLEVIVGNTRNTMLYRFANLSSSTMDFLSYLYGNSPDPFVHLGDRPVVFECRQDGELEDKLLPGGASNSI